MKKIYLLAAVAAVLCGLFTFLFLNSGNSGGPKTEVVVATEDIPPYTKITDDMVTTEKVSSDAVLPNTAKDASEVVGKLSSNSFVEGQQFVVSQLGTENNVGEALSYQIADGMRAMTVFVDCAPGVGGYVTDGDHIDLYRKVTSGNTWTGKVQTVVQDVHVLKAGELGYSSENGPYSYLTLELTPKQCREVYSVTANPTNDTNSIFYATLRPRSES